MVIVAGHINPSDEQGAAMLSGSVTEYDIAEERPLFDG